MTLRVAAEYTGVSLSTLRGAPDFPAPVQLTPGRRVYLRESVDAWLDHRAGRRPAEIDADDTAEMSRRLRA